MGTNRLTFPAFLTQILDTARVICVQSHCDAMAKDDGRYENRDQHEVGCEGTAAIHQGFWAV